jgi:hypothetical protein
MRIHRFIAAVCLVSLVGLGGSLFAEESADSIQQGAGSALVSPVLTVGTNVGYYNNDTYYDGTVINPFISIGIETKNIELYGELALYDTKKYEPFKADLPGSKISNLWFNLEEGGIKYHNGPLSFDAGRFKHYDQIDSPYSLFVNSNGISTLLMNMRYEDDFFFYESRWLCLTNRSYMNVSMTSNTAVDSDGNTYSTVTAFPSGYPDRGANIKAYGFKFKNGMRFGFQDAAVYTGRSFDLEYFLNPIPQYFIQYAKTNGGRPWATGGNENDIIGMFWDWAREDGYSFNSQILIDDFSMHGLSPSQLPANPWKLAWTFGGRKELDSNSSVGFYHAGATRYTFEPITMDDASQVDENCYGYTYYPDTRFDDSYDFDFSEPEAIQIEDNAIGYKYGENNLAFQADYKYEVKNDYKIGAALEYVIAGSNSPANPWGDLAKHPHGTKLLNDSVLENRILAKFAATKSIGAWDFSAKLVTGVRFNAMELESAGASDPDYTQSIYIWEPQSGNTVAVLDLMFGAKYAWRMR